MNIEQLKLTIQQQNTPWDDIRDKTEKYSNTPIQYSSMEDLTAKEFAEAFRRSMAGQQITTSQSDMTVWYLNNKIFVRLDIYENTLGSPRHTGSVLFTSEDGQEFTKTVVSKKRLQGVQYINGRFIVNDIDGIYYSKSGYNWDYVSGEDISENCDYIRDITHDGKQYIVLYDDSDDVQFIAKAKKIKTGWESFELDVEEDCYEIAFCNDIYYLQGETEDGTCVVYTSDDVEYWCEADESDASDSDDVEVGDYYIEEDEDDDNLYLCRKAAPYDSDRIYDENIFFFCENNREIYAKELPKGKKYKLAEAPFDVKCMFFHEGTLLLFGTHLEFASGEVTVSE